MDLPAVILLGLVAVVLYELIKLKVRIRLKMRLPGEPFVVVVQEVQVAAASAATKSLSSAPEATRPPPRPMKRFWEMLVGELKVEAAARGLAYQGVLKEDLIVALVEANRLIYKV